MVWVESPCWPFQCSQLVRQACVFAPPSRLVCARLASYPGVWLQSSLRVHPLPAYSQHHMPVFLTLCWTPFLNKMGSQCPVPCILYVQASLSPFHIHGWIALRNAGHNHWLSQIVHTTLSVAEFSWDLDLFIFQYIVHLHHSRDIHTTFEEVSLFCVSATWRAELEKEKKEEEKQEQVKADSLVGGAMLE